MDVAKGDAGGAAGLAVVRLSQRPDLAPAMWAAGDRIWPAFMLHDPVGDRYYGRVVDDFGDWTLLAVDADERVVAKAHFLPCAGGWDDLPDRGWDAVVEQGVADHDAGRTPTMASALEIGIVPEARRRGLSGFMLDRMRRVVAELGIRDLVAPVRPSGKHAFPHESMQDYLARRTDEGLPFDPWLRVHVRAGGQVVKVAPESMRITGSLERWHDWTGMTFDTDGPTVVPGALVPVSVDLAADRATYVEPNVWIHHDLRP